MQTIRIFSNRYNAEILSIVDQMVIPSKIILGAKPTCCSRFRNIPRLPFVKDRLRCTGKEDMLADCSHDNSQISRCNGATVAGVQCPGTYTHIENNNNIISKFVLS